MRADRLAIRGPSPSRRSMLAPSPFPAVPLDLSSFVGREAELRRFGDDLAAVRLLTLTGPGGSGKTRLALELARRCARDHPVVWVELADLVDFDGVVRRLGRAMAATSDAAGIDDLLDALPPGTVVALDNCEHLLGAAASLTEAILRRPSGLRVLATSREPLGLPGERARAVPPMSVEADGECPEAVRLFVERAREVQPDFDLDGHNRATVQAICRELDGIPLAIELAAARTRMFTAAQIHGRLHDALDLLSRGGRATVPRHRTLRATLDWSHELLEDPCALLLRRLSVFHGGASLEAVEGVAGHDEDPFEVIESLTRLVDRSWVTVREVGGFARYHLLETVRMYAAERLEASGEGEGLRARHGAWIVALVEEARPHFTGPNRRVWVDRLTPEFPNLWGALTWTLAHDPALHLRLAASLWWFWFSSRHWAEARRWLEGALALPEAAAGDRRRADLVFALGALDALQGRSVEARPWLDEALDLAGALGDESLAAYTRVYLGMSLAQIMDPDAERHLEPARDWLQEHGDLYLLRLAQILLGSAYANRGDMEAALAVTREGVETARAFGQDRELGISLQALGILLFQVKNYGEARIRLLESLGALERDPSIMFLARTLHFVGLCAAEAGDAREAVRLLAAAEGARAGLGVKLVSIDADLSMPRLAMLREGLGDTLFESLWRAGMAEELDGVVAGALAAATPAPLDGAHPAGASSSARGTGARDSATAGAVAPVGTQPDLRARLLGGFEVEISGEPIPDDRWVYARPKELLALLLLHREGRTRDQIAAAMWPDSGPAQARNSINVTLHHLRKALGRAEWIELVEGRYRIAPSVRVEVDLERFEAVAISDQVEIGEQVEIGDLQAAWASYRGDLLSGEVSGRWVDEWADRLRRLRRDVGWRLGLALEAAGDEEAAEAVYSGLVLSEELDEELHRQLMTLRFRRGDRDGVATTFERLAAALRDLGAEPENATVSLFEQVVEGVPRAAP